MMDEVNKKPPREGVSCGGVHAAAWVDNRVVNNEVVKVYSIKLDRSYKEDGEWKYTDVFSAEDLLKVALVAMELYKRLRLHSYGDKQQNNDNPPNTGS